MRKSRAKRREVMPDPKFGSTAVTRFVNNLMFAGKKDLAFRLFYGALDIVEKRKEDPELTAFEVWERALDNIRPRVELKSRRVGGGTLQVPTLVRDNRKDALAMKWMIRYARSRNEKSMVQKLAGEILAAFKEEGAAVKKRVDTQKMAEANKAFARFGVL